MITKQDLKPISNFFTPDVIIKIVNIIIDFMTIKLNR